MQDLHAILKIESDICTYKLIININETCNYFIIVLHYYSIWVFHFYVKRKKKISCIFLNSLLKHNVCKLYH